MELAGVNALPELGVGLLFGAALVTIVVALLMAVGGYRIAGSNGLSAAVIKPLAMMTFVGVLEEVLSRGIVFRIIEQSLGSWTALAISSLLFGLAHLPGEGAGVLAIVINVVAGVLFAAAYLLTRRLWLGIGIYIAWNYTLGSIYSIAVSGREAKGLLQGTISGPDWLTGGAYGLEASVFTLVILATVTAYLLRKAWARGPSGRSAVARAVDPRGKHCPQPIAATPAQTEKPSRQLRVAGRLVDSSILAASKHIEAGECDA